MENEVMHIIIAILLTFLVTTFFGHLVHWLLHRKWSGFLNRSHMVHHLKNYPPSDFVSVKYRSAGKDSTPKFFIMAGLPLLAAPVVLWWLGTFSLVMMIVVLVTELIVGFLHDYLHDAFHIKGHWLSRVYAVRRLFAHWTALHYLHHVDMNTNLGIFFFGWDRVFFSFVRYVKISFPDNTTVSLDK
jgi:hypothetical protein